MSIAQRGSRPIEIDGVAYRWIIRKKTTRAQAARETTMSLAVQREGERSVLVVDLGLRRPTPWIDPHQTQVTPERVREIVRSALAAGWSPGQGGTFLHAYPIIRDA